MLSTRSTPAPTSRSGTASRGGDGWWFAGLCLAMLALYASTLCRTVYWYDSAELATASAVLGIPHPPGYPLYTLLGFLYVKLLPGEPALAVNAMSAVHGALCVGLLFLIQRRLDATRPAALCGALLFATGPSFWLNASVAEVYTTGLAFALLAWWLLLGALASGRRLPLVAAAFVAGLGFSAHMFVATLGLGYVLLAVCAARGAPRDPARTRWAWLGPLGLCALAGLLGSSLYLYLPIRAQMKPALNYLGPASVQSVAWMVTGGNYKTWFLHGYSRIERLLYVLSLLDAHVTDLGLVLGALGGGVLLWRRRAVGLALLLGALGNLWFFFNYDVHDLEVFFLPTAALLCACIGPLLGFAGEALDTRASTRLLARVAVGICLAYAALRAVLVAPTVDLSRDRSAQRYGQQLAATLPRGAILLVCGTPGEWKYRTVFDYYFQKVLHRRPDVEAIDLAGDLVATILEGGANDPRVAPALRGAFQRVFASGRPVYMYKQIDALDPLLRATPEGELVRVQLRSP